MWAWHTLGEWCGTANHLACPWDSEGYMECLAVQAAVDVINPSELDTSVDREKSILIPSVLHAEPDLLAFVHRNAFFCPLATRCHGPRRRPQRLGPRRYHVIAGIGRLFCLFAPDGPARDEASTRHR